MLDHPKLVATRSVLSKVDSCLDPFSKKRQRQQLQGFQDFLDGLEEIFTMTRILELLILLFRECFVDMETFQSRCEEILFESPTISGSAGSRTAFRRNLSLQPSTDKLADDPIGILV